jgi:N-methylhydantoinase A
VAVDLGPAVFKRRDREAIKRQFDAVHLRRYGSSAPEERAEIVSLRATVTGVMKKPPLERLQKGGRSPVASAARGKRPVWFTDRYLKTASYDRAALRAGNRIAGPALIEEYASTTVLMPGDRVEVDRFGNLVMEIGR